MNKTKKYNTLITVLSIAIPIVVAILFGYKIPNATPLTFLPPIYASINAFTAVVLITAIWAIKANKRILHERLIKLAMLCTSVFLIMYVAYHMTSESTPYGGEGALKYIYFFILISHIILSITVIPMVLITFVRALNQDFQKHKKLARFAFPIWLYIEISGVIVYLMISPYYS
jgi:putative membrane protein